MNICRTEGHDTYIDYYDYHIGCATCLHTQPWPTPWMTTTHKPLTYDNIHFINPRPYKRKNSERTAE